MHDLSPLVESLGLSPPKHLPSERNGYNARRRVLREGWSNTADAAEDKDNRAATAGEDVRSVRSSASFASATGASATTGDGDLSLLMDPGANGVELVESWEAHAGAVTALALVDDPPALLSASADGIPQIVLSSHPTA